MNWRKFQQKKKVTRSEMYHSVPRWHIVCAKHLSLQFLSLPSLIIHMGRSPISYCTVLGTVSPANRFFILMLRYRVIFISYITVSLESSPRCYRFLQLYKRHTAVHVHKYSSPPDRLPKPAKNSLVNFQWNLVNHFIYHNDNKIELSMQACSQFIASTHYLTLELSVDNNECTMDNNNYICEHHLGLEQVNWPSSLLPPLFSWHTRL